MCMYRVNSHKSVSRGEVETCVKKEDQSVYITNDVGIIGY